MKYWKWPTLPGIAVCVSANAESNPSANRYTPVWPPLPPAMNATLSPLTTTFTGLGAGGRIDRPSLERTAITGVKSALSTVMVRVPAPSEFTE